MSLDLVTTVCVCGHDRPDHDKNGCIPCDVEWVAGDGDRCPLTRQSDPAPPIWADDATALESGAP